MLKQAIAVILIFAFLVQTFSQAIVVFNFYTHQSYIAANLCENRDKPQLKCCGKCQLKKKLNEQQGNSSESLKRLDWNADDVIVPAFSMALSGPVCFVSRKYPDLIVVYPPRIASRFFHPPGLTLA